MKGKRFLTVTVVMVLTVLILLSSCTMEDVEYAGEVLDNVQSNGIGALTDIRLPPVITDIVSEIPPIFETDPPQTMPPYTGPITTPPVQTTPQIQTTPAVVVNKDNFTPAVECPKDGIIKSAAQLHAVLVNGKSDAAYTVVAEELDMEGLGWKGMSNYSATFDFGGCVIKNAKYPLFRSVKGATVKNLIIAESKYEYFNDEAMKDADPKTGEKGNTYFSPVICYAQNVTVSNVTIQPSVSVTSDIWTEKSYHGGIVAAAEGDNIVIENCHFNGEYTTDSLLVYFGGIVGSAISENTENLSAESPEKASVRIVDCSSTGTLINFAYGNDSKMGGIVGRITNGAVIGCGNYGVVKSNDSGQTAGVVAYVGGAAYVKNCINTASVHGAMYVGGICGYSNGDGRYFENCINLGAVTSEAAYYGGVLGSVRKTEKLINCFNLVSGCANFAYQYSFKVIIDPANASTHYDLSITNCANLENVESILNKINAAAPSVFERSQNGLLVLS